MVVHSLELAGHIRRSRSHTRTEDIEADFVAAHNRHRILMAVAGSVAPD